MKKLIISIIVNTICMSFCACGGAKVKENSNFNHTVKQMQKDVYMATITLSSANEDIIASVYAMKQMDEKTALTKFKHELNLIKSIRVKIDNSISSPNFIAEELENLEENYEYAVALLTKYAELSEEETGNFNNILLDGTHNHIFLLKSLYAFSFLYEIREFDQLPDYVAQISLKDNWWKFGFNNDIKCPETIDK